MKIYDSKRPKWEKPLGVLAKLMFDARWIFMFVILNILVKEFTTWIQS